MDSITFCSLNCRGLGDRRKRIDVFDYLAKRKYSIICLQDVHWINEHEKLYYSEWGNDIYFSAYSSNSRGVAILINKSLPYKKLDFRHDKDGNYVVLIFQLKDYVFNLVNLYGPNSDSPTFYHTVLNESFGHDSDFNIFCGDWNLVQDFNLDCSNYANLNNPRAHRAVLEIKSDYNLVDPWRTLHPDSLQYTWRRRSPIKQARLDFFLVSENLLNIINACNILPGYRSDHSCVVLQVAMSNIQRGRGYWKFNNALLQNSDYIKLVNNIIDECILQYCLSPYNRENVLNIPFNDLQLAIDADLFLETILFLIRGETIKFSSRFKKENEQKETRLLEEISQLEQHNLNDEAAYDILYAKRSELEEIRQSYTKGAMIRSRGNWIEWGEKPTKFFLNLERKNALDRSILCLKNQHGSIITDQNEIMKEAHCYFSHLFKVNNHYDDKTLELFLSGFDIPILNKEHNDLLDCTITIHELSESVNKLKNDKSPGLDGFTSEFLKYFWPRLSSIFYSALHCSWQKGILSSTLRQGVIILIPKKNKPRNLLSNWRPISLISNFYKIISHCIASRLKVVLPHLIHDNQKGFMAGRYIGENIRLLYDILLYSDLENIPGHLIMVDFEKAFDTISHSFIWQVLDFWGFGPTFINWCKLLYNQGSSSVLVNGNRSPLFDIGRGCRQGDPLSPYLFILCVEMLAIRIRGDNLIKGITLPGCNVKLIQYADDMAFITDGSDISFKSVISNLEYFHSISGLKVNYDKTYIFSIGALRLSKNIVKGFHRFVWDPGGFFTFLGVTFSLNVSEMVNINFEKIVTIVNDVICSWSRRKLTTLGKITVIKSLILPKLNHLFLSIPNPSEDFLNTIEKMLYSFIWNGPDRIQRKQLCLPYEQGGLRMIDLKLFIDSMKLTWLRRFFYASSHSSTYCLFRYFLFKHVPYFWEGGATYLQSRLRFVSNAFYVDISNALIRLRYSLDAKSNVTPNTSQTLWLNNLIQVGNRPLFIKNWIDKGINFIDDLINSDGVFYSLENFISTYNCQSNFLEYEGVLRAVKSFLKANSSKKISRPFIPDLFQLILKSRKGGSDFYKCLLSNTNVVRKSEDKWRVDIKNDNLNWRYIYNLPFSLYLESKYSWFQFRINTRILSTRSYLFKINISNSDLCSFCKKEKETIIHIFSSCEMVLPLWLKFKDTVYACTENVLVLNHETMIFGICTYHRSNKVLNTLLIWLRFYIYRCKMRDEILSYKSFKNYTLFLIKGLHYNAVLNFTLDNFKKQWGPWLHHFNFTFPDYPLIV